MVAIPYIKKKIGSFYLVWFQNSNLYIQLEEPAWFVFIKTTKRYKPETIAKEFSARYDVTGEESLSFVMDIRLQILAMNQTEPSKDKVNEASSDLNKLT
ncbi:MAG: hypothetical protein Q8N05_04505, partial [Bacteroidota bacterium]|nr:hypothetical protein [Bacteroidota bacterium]